MKLNGTIRASAPRVIKTYLAIKVRVPKQGAGMNLMPAFTGNDGKTVPQYWRFGRKLRNGKILNFCFHGIDASLLGKNITATVDVEKNKSGYVQITCRHTPNVPWTRTMVVHEAQPGQGAIKIYPDSPECFVLTPR